ACDVDTGTGGDQCTLRAAIEQANHDNVTQTIDFNATVAGNTISPATVLPTIIVNQLTIDGCTSGANANSAGPCVAIDGASQAFDGFHVSADDVTIKGLAITDMDHGIATDSGADRLIVRNSWFGMML